MPDKKNTWLTEGQQDDYESLAPLGTKASKGEQSTKAIFRNFSLGVASNRDAYNYNSGIQELRRVTKRAIDAYNETLARFKAQPTAKRKSDGFVSVEDNRVKWTRQTKSSLTKLEKATEDTEAYRISLYRPFETLNFYFQDFWNEERYQQPHLFPTSNAESENRVICTSGVGSSKPFQCLATDKIVSLDLLEKTQCFSFYTYDEDGTNRRDNITDWSLAQFRTHYGQQSTSKWEIFHYTYALLHHPEYRTRYAANLKRELPRIPYAPDFQQYAEIGAALMTLHIEYEKQPEYPLDRQETGKLDWKVVKLSLSKDKTQLKYNDFLTLTGIPPEVYEYKLGNRSALEWVIDQYQISTDKRSGITNDPTAKTIPNTLSGS